MKRKKIPFLKSHKKKKTPFIKSREKKKTPFVKSRGFDPELYVPSFRAELENAMALSHPINWMTKAEAEHYFYRKQGSLMDIKDLTEEITEIVKQMRITDTLIEAFDTDSGSRKPQLSIRVTLESNKYTFPLPERLVLHDTLGVPAEELFDNLREPLLSVFAVQQKVAQDRLINKVARLAEILNAPHQH